MDSKRPAALDQSLGLMSLNTEPFPCTVPPENNMKENKRKPGSLALPCCPTDLLAQEQFHVNSQWIKHNIKYIFPPKPTEQANSSWRKRQNAQWHRICRICLCPIKHPSRVGETIRLRLKKYPGWNAWGVWSKAHPTGGAKGRRAGDDRDKRWKKTVPRDAG